MGENHGIPLSQITYLMDTGLHQAEGRFLK